jgi:hypothetical protein
MTRGRPRRRLPNPEWRAIISRERGQPAQFFEEASSGASRSAPLSFRVPPNQLALASVPFDPSVFPAAVWLQDLLREGTVFFEPDSRTLRRASPPTVSRRLDPTGRNLSQLANRLQTENPNRFQAWVDHVQTALPRVTDVRVIERTDDRYAYFAVTYENGHEVGASGLSDGTLRVLALTLLPYLDLKVSVLVTEEPENGLHPRAIEAVLQPLRSVYDAQVWISTHSPMVLAQTSLDEILTASLMPEGAVEIIPGRQHPRLVDWKGSADLGTLFAAGVLG